jgi:hypothetical protein
MFYNHSVMVYTSPELLQRIRSLAVTDMNDATCVKIDNDGLVYMPFADGKLIDADVLYATDIQRGIPPGKPALVDLLDRVPCQMQMPGDGLDGRKLKHIHYKVFQTFAVGALTMDEVDMLIPVTAAFLAFHTTDLGMQQNRGMSYRDRLDVTPNVTIPYYVAAFTARTTLF